MNRIPDSAARFDGRAADYARYRPGYPPGAIDEIFAGMGDLAGLLVVDVGAGTGISSLLLAERGANVVAVDPNEEMLAVARAAGLDARGGVADRLEFEPDSVDLVTCFQAFHWFANADATAELARILRPGGRVALVWNERDDSDAFMRGYGDAVDGFANRLVLAGFENGPDAIRSLLRDANFRNVRVASYPNAQRLDYEGLRGRLRSTSYAPTEGPAHTKLIAQLDELFAKHKDRENTVVLSHRTDVYLAEKPA